MSAPLTTNEYAGPCLLSDRARALLAEPWLPQGFVEKLEESELYRDALEFLAHWLPKREAVWWGCLCLRHVLSPPAGDGEDSTRRVLVNWVMAPTEPARRLAEEAWERAGSHSLAGILALAVFCSGGSVSGPGLPDVPPAPHLTASIVAQAVFLAGLENPETKTESFRLFIGLGLGVARGEFRWA